jgi:peptide/nickel transport system permease protein
LSLLKESLLETLLSFKDFSRRFVRHKFAVLSVCIVFGLALLAVFADIISPYPPLEQDLLHRYAAPNVLHLFGTDRFGRDILSRIIYGARTSFYVGFSVVAICLLMGVTVGCVSGYFGGMPDELLMRTVDVFLVLPTFFLVLVAVALFGSSLFNVVIIIGVTSWPTIARLIRAEFLSLRERDFVKAAIVSRASRSYIIFREILPNAMYSTVVQSTLEIGSAILTEAALSFLGLGDPRIVSWGQMLNDAMYGLGQAWWDPLFPGLFIGILVLAFNVIGDGINDALNPYLRELK